MCTTFILSSISTQEHAPIKSPKQQCAYSNGTGRCMCVCYTLSDSKCVSVNIEDLFKGAPYAEDSESSDDYCYIDKRKATRMRNDVDLF
eukprot:14591-Heterococcus_DN1.PRE.2